MYILKADDFVLTVDDREQLIKILKGYNSYYGQLDIFDEKGFCFTVYKYEDGEYHFSHVTLFCKCWDSQLSEVIRILTEPYVVINNIPVPASIINGDDRIILNLEKANEWLTEIGHFIRLNASFELVLGQSYAVLHLEPLSVISIIRLENLIKSYDLLEELYE